MKNKNLIANFRKYGIFVVLVAICILFACLSPVFLSGNNLIKIMRQVSMIGIASIGAMFVILLGGIDLSQGAMLSFTNIVCAYLMVNMKMNQWLAILLCILISTGIGYINGILVTVTKIPALIATLGTQYVFFGWAYIICKGQTIYGFPSTFQVIGQGYVGIIPVPVILMVIFMIIGGFILNKTYLGRYFYAVGGNAEAAKLSGIKVPRVRRIAFTLCGLFTGIASIITLSRVNSGQANSGDGFEFDCISAIVLGGVSVSGGAGRLYNVIAGVLIIGILNNGLVLIGMSNYYQKVIKGIILVAAVGFDCMQRASEK